MKIHRVWMVVTGIAGVALFAIANLHEHGFWYGVFQIVVNIFVFTAWLNGFNKTSGLEKFVAFFGVLIPPILAAVTLIRVIF